MACRLVIGILFSFSINGVFFLSVLFPFISHAQTTASGLSNDQISAIVGLLASFGADEATVANVRVALSGTSGTSSSILAVVFTRDMALNATGSDVIALQKRLVSEKLLTVAPTGFFGPLTQKAVIAYQKKYGLPATSFVGPLTRAKLNGTGSLGTNQPSQGNIAPPASELTTGSGLLQGGTPSMIVGGTNDESVLPSPTAASTSVDPADAAGNAPSQSASASSTTQATVVSTKFSQNDRVYVLSGPLNVRATPSVTGILRGTQTTNNLGTVIYGPTIADGFSWWNINYDTGVDGWSAENFLAKYTALALDTTAPSIPANLSAVAISTSQTNLSWTAATDAVGVTGYRVYRNGSLIASPADLASATSYTYTVAAIDAAGNLSAQSSAVNVITQTAPIMQQAPSAPSSGSSSASVPVILYTDALSGPITGGENNKGAYLSIFGYNFGSSADLGTNTKVYIGGAEVDNYRYLGASKVYDKLGVQQITVQVGALGNPTLGIPLPVKVVVGDSNSNTDKTFTPNPGRILFVSLAGNDATAVPDDISHPYRYMQSATQANLFTSGAYGAVRAGDHIIVRGGNWSDTSVFDAWLRFTTYYSSQAQAALRKGSAPIGGTNTGWIHITAYPGPINGNVIEDVHYSTPAGKKGGIHGPGSSYRGVTGDYISISNLRMDVNASAQSDAAPINTQYANGPWRAVNNELGPWPTTALIGYAGGITGNGLKNYQLYGNYIHDIASLPSSLTNHGIYIGDGDGGDIAYNHIANITGGNGFQAADTTNGNPTDNTIIHHNVIHTVAKHGVNLGNGVRANNSVYNNLIYNIDQGCIRFNTNTVTNAKIYNNTCYNTQMSRITDPHWSGAGALMNDWNPPGNAFDIRNNIFYTVTDTQYIGGSVGFAGIATFSNNLF